MVMGGGEECGSVASISITAQTSAKAHASPPSWVQELDFTPKTRRQTSFHANNAMNVMTTPQREKYDTMLPTSTLRKNPRLNGLSSRLHQKSTIATSATTATMRNMSRLLSGCYSPPGGSMSATTTTEIIHCQHSRHYRSSPPLEHKWRQD